MEQIINRTFRLWAYTVSHGGLVIRSEQKFEDQSDYDARCDHNIDMEFVSVAYLDIPTTFICKSLITVKDSVPEKFKVVLENTRLKLYRIESEFDFHFVIASNCLIAENKWIGESRVSNMQLKHDRTIAVL